MPESIPELLATLAAALETEETSRSNLSEARRVINETRTTLHKLAPHHYLVDPPKAVPSLIAAPALEPPAQPPAPPLPPHLNGRAAPASIVQDLASAPQPSAPWPAELAERESRQPPPAVPLPAPPPRRPRKDLSTPPVASAITLAAYAELRGCTPVNIAMAIRVGRIEPPAVFAGDWIDPEAADRQLANSERDSPLRRAAREAIANRKAERAPLPAPARLIKAEELPARVKPAGRAPQPAA